MEGGGDRWRRGDGYGHLKRIRMIKKKEKKNEKTKKKKKKKTKEQEEEEEEEEKNPRKDMMNASVSIPVKWITTGSAVCKLRLNHW